MQIQFKQSEIQAALRQYIESQGINLNGKAVDIQFSATRGDAGIVATVNIEKHLQLPDLNDEPEVAGQSAKPQLSVVASTSVTAKDLSLADGDVNPAGEPQEAVTGTDTAAAPKSTGASLFN